MWHAFTVQTCITRKAPCRLCTIFLPGLCAISIGLRAKKGARTVTVRSTKEEEPKPASLFSSIEQPEQVAPTKLRLGTPITGPDLAEVLKKFKRLQNGSDIRGVAVDGTLLHNHMSMVLQTDGIVTTA